MYELFIIIVFTGGFGLLLCLGVGVTNLIYKLSDIYDQNQLRKELKRSPEKAKINFEQYNQELKKEAYSDREKNIQLIGFRQL